MNINKYLTGTLNNLDFKTVLAYIGMSLIALASCYGFLYPLHYGDTYEFHISAIALVYVYFGIFFLRFSVTGISINLTSIAMVGIAFLIGVQPVFNKIYYPEDLIFPVLIMLTMAYLSSLLFNHNNKEKLIQTFCIVFVIGIILNGIILCCQFIQLDVSGYWYIRSLTSGERFSGNTAQPNQFASIIMVGIAICIYFSIIAKKRLVSITSLVTIGFFCIILALTTSRAGLAAFIFSLLFILLFAPYKDFKSRIFVTTFMLGFYYLGMQLLSLTTVSVGQDTVSRLNEGSLWMRISQIKQAWLMFKESPLFGFGWNSYLDYNSRLADQIEFVNIVRHSHSLVGQVISEMGLLGVMFFLPFVYLLLTALLKCIKKIRTPQTIQPVFFVSLLSVSVILIYSMAEYPLWYVYFLVPITIFLSGVDSKVIRKLTLVKKNTKLLLINSILCIVLATVSYIYRQSYIKYKWIDYKTNDLTLNKNRAEFYLDQVYFPIGMRKFKERVLFKFIDKYNMPLNEKIKMGGRVMSQLSTNHYMMTYIDLLERKGDVKNAATYRVAACKRGIKQYC